MISKFNNFQHSDSQDENLYEGNFISKDPSGIFDASASAKLSELTIDKLFEGLDLEKSDQMHRFISVNSPSVQDVMDINQTDDLFAFEIIKQQMNYISDKIRFVEKDLEKYYNFIISAYKNTSDDKLGSAIAGFTSPEGYSSIIPDIENLVKKAKESGVNFKDFRVLEAFNTLHRINISNLISEISLVLEESASTFGIVNIYKKIDKMDLMEIESDTANSIPETYVTKQLNFDVMYKSNDPIARMSAFFEEVLDVYPYVKILKRNFGDNYSIIEDGDLVKSSINQFLPKMDYSAFDLMKNLLNQVCGLLVNRVYISNPVEDSKNIFVPALQAIYIGLLTIISTKLINFNIEVDTTKVKKEEDKKAVLAKTALERSWNIYNSYKLLINQGFFIPGSGVYKEGGVNMNPEIIKNINYFLHSLNLLPESKVTSDVFDRVTTDAVIKFQANHKAQKVDGKIGSETKAIMDKIANTIGDKYNII
jgi:hypothetical protein